MKPASAIGRTLIWKVSAEMFLKNPISGVGYGNFANAYNYYQVKFFVNGGGNTAQKMMAGQVRHAYNWYLETAAEFGIFGLIVFCIFWWLILVEAYKIFFPRNTRKDTEHIQTEYRTLQRSNVYFHVHTDYLTLGLAGAVLCFMIMSLFQFPNKIIPTYLIFNVALAWIVNVNESHIYSTLRAAENIEKKVTLSSSCSSWMQKLFWSLAFVVSLFFAVIYFQQYMAGSTQLTIMNEVPDSLPFSLFKRGNLKKEALIRVEYINKAINNWKLSSNIQPWRLTPKFHLADLFCQLGDTNNAIKYARLVVNTPMKKWTERGKEFKLKSQKMLIAMGEKCDDPGLIVFDINAQVRQ